MAFSQVDTLAIDITKWHSISESDFEMKYPQNWKVTRSELGYRFTLIDSTETDEVRKQIFLRSQPTVDDLNGYVQRFESDIKTLLYNGRVFFSERFNFDGNEFHMIIHSGRYGQSNYKLESHIMIKNNNIYELTIKCPYITFDDFQFFGAKILSTFKLK